MKLIKQTILLLTLLVFTTVSFANTKPNLTYVYGTECGYCAEFQANVLSSGAVQSELKHFNVTKTTRHISSVVPFVIISKDGKTVYSGVPPLNAQQFLNILRRFE